MISVRLQIGDGEVEDTYEKYGFVYCESDTRYAAPIKSHETTTYAEQAGENMDVRTVDDAFDYKVAFVVEARMEYGGVKHANELINAFNALLYDKDGDIKTFKQVTFYNDYKNVKIVGVPEPIQEATDFFIHKGEKYDWCKVEWTIRVTNPNLCNFAAAT